MLHIGRGRLSERRSALVNEFILRPWLIETAILGGTRPRCYVRVGICVNMPKEKGRCQIMYPGFKVRTAECRYLLGSHQDHTRY